MNKGFTVMASFAAILLLQGCTRTVPVYMPGKYQDGMHHSAGYQPAHFNAYGQFIPGQKYAGYYQEGRWHRAYYDYRVERVEPKPWVADAITNTLVGGVVGAGVGALVTGGDMAATMITGSVGAVIGAANTDYSDE